jgi:hypothetical protein
MPHPQTAEEWVTRTALDWPTLYPTREKLLSSMFCTHHWSTNPRFPGWLVSKKRSFLYGHAPWTDDKYGDEQAARANAERGLVVNGRIVYLEPRVERLYPLQSDNVALIKIPSDVQADWFSLAVETTAVMAHMARDEEAKELGQRAVGKLRQRDDLRERFPHFPSLLDHFEEFFAKRYEEAVQSTAYLEQLEREEREKVELEEFRVNAKAYFQRRNEAKLSEAER